MIIHHNPLPFWFLPLPIQLALQMFYFDETLAVHSVELVIVLLHIARWCTQKMYSYGARCDSLLISLYVASP